LLEFRVFWCLFVPGETALQPCGAKVPAKQSNTSGLHAHIRDNHPAVYRESIQSAGDIQLFFPGWKSSTQKDQIAVAFAENALPYQVLLLQIIFLGGGVDRSFLQLIDSPSFRLAFGDKIPRGFNRQELSAHVRTLRDSVQSKLYSKLAGRDVFLLVDGGTLNRHRLLNVCVGSNGMSYFKSLNHFFVVIPSGVARNRNLSYCAHCNARYEIPCGAGPDDFPQTCFNKLRL